MSSLPPPLSASRCAKAVMLACLSAFAALVTFNNLSDYGSNFAFVQHVLAMDTVFADSAAHWCAIEQPWLWHGAYGLIIACEGLAAVLQPIEGYRTLALQLFGETSRAMELTPPPPRPRRRRPGAAARYPPGRR